MRIAFVLLLVCMSCGGCTWLALGVNNAHHMTLERAITPRVEQRVRVLDAETGEPVAGAHVVVVHNFDWMDDWVVEGTSGADGVATLRLATEYLHLVSGHVTATGYHGRDDFDINVDSNDAADVHIYREPSPSMGLRVPNGFVGSFVYRLGKTKYDFAFPPTFPAGQRVWWTEVDPAGAETVVEQPPLLGGTGWDGVPVARVTRGEQEISTPPPGADVAGIAAWHIGVREPNGPWGGDWHVVVIGDRDAALAKAQQEWTEHRNGEAGFIYNGWLRLVSPETKLSKGGAYAVTRDLGGK